MFGLSVHWRRRAGENRLGFAVGVREEPTHSTLGTELATQITLSCTTPLISISSSNISEDSQLFCSAYNDVSSQSSEFVTLQLLQPGDKNCVYFISSKGELCTLVVYLKCFITFLDILILVC